MIPAIKHTLVGFQIPVITTPVTDATVLAKTAHYWALEGGWADLKGAANLTANGTVAIGTSLSGNGTGSAEFSGASHLECLDTTRGRMTDECTLMFVYQSKSADANGTHYNLLGKHDTGSNGKQEWFVSLNHGVTGRERIRFIYSSTGTASAFADGAQMLTRRDRHLVTIDYSKSAGTIRIAMDNGTPATINVTPFSFFQGAAKFAIGAVFNNDARSGAASALIDCMLISSTPLSQSEKDYIWNGGSIRQLALPTTQSVLPTIALATGAV